MKHASNFKDLTGQSFGRLSVIKLDGKNKHGHILWLCKCDCGNIITTTTSCLNGGNMNSCGCLHKEIASKTHKGRKRSTETRKRLSKSKMGMKNPAYNPNLTDEDRINRKYILGYRSWRKAVLKRDNYICQVCGQVGGNLNAHHLESYNSNPKLRTTLSNGATTCENCHKDFHHQYGYGNNTKKQFEKFKGGNTNED